MRLFIKLFIFVLLVALPMSAMAQKPRPQYENIYEIPRFIIFDDATSKVEFMKQISASLQTRLVEGPRSVRFLDSDNVVTKASLDKYIKLETKQIARSQKRALVALDLDGDRLVSFAEYLQQGGYDVGDMVRLRDIIREHGVEAIEKIQPILDKMEQVENKKITPLTFYTETIPTFIELDLDGDNVLSYTEMKTPSQTAVTEKTRRTVSQFQAYLSLSDDGQKTTLEQINEASEKAFNTLDVNENGTLDNSEVSLYLRARLPKQECHVLPKLNDQDAYLYAIGLSSSNVAAPVDFTGDPKHGMTGYVDVEIKKQSKPINLFVGLDEKAIWNFKGDVKSIKNLVVFGVGPSRMVSGDNFNISKVHAGVIGVPDDKITFINRHECWNFRIPHKNFTDYANNEAFQNARGLTRYLSGRYPHLLKLRTGASKIVIEEQPQITFFDETNDSYKKAPEGYNRDLWDAFLQYKSAGLAKPDLSQMVSGFPYYKDNIAPSWAGIAQLDHAGVAELVYSDIENRKAVMLLKKDLPFFPNVTHSNPPTMTFVLDNSKLGYPDPKHAQGASRACIMTRDGKVLHGHRNCAKSDLAHLKSDTQKPDVNSDPIYLSLTHRPAVLPSFKDSIDIIFEIDERRCERQYGENFQDKCRLPDSITSKPIPVYALDIDPPIDGELSWKNASTLTFTPSQSWNAGQLYKMSVNLDNFDVPKGIYVNEERAAALSFYVSRIYVEAENVSIADDPYDATKQIVTADLTSNYPISDLSLTVVHVPKEAVQPDEHIFHTDLGYENFGVSYETQVRHFEMPDLSKKLKLYVHKRDDGLQPTHLRIGDPTGRDASEIYPVRPFWVAFEDQEIQEIPDAMQDVYAKAVAGDALAQLALGKAYMDGDRILKSLSRARKWLNAAVVQGAVPAMVQLGHLDNTRYLWEYDGSIEAYVWFKKAALRGDKEAQHELAQMDCKERVKWLERSAAQGYAPAVLALGETYRLGYCDIEVGLKKALEYYMPLAEKGDAKGMIDLSVMYLKGKGVDVDTNKAYALAGQALQKLARDEQKYLRRGSWVIAQLLMEKSGLFDVDSSKSRKDYEVLGQKISQVISKDFKEPYIRVWIAQEIANAWDGHPRFLIVAKEIIKNQKETTPDLPELKFVDTDIFLSENYHSGDQYNPIARAQAIKTLEGLQGNGYFDFKVISRLAYLYLSEGRNKDEVLNYLNRLRIEKKYSIDDLWSTYNYVSRQREHSIEELVASKDPNDAFSASYRKKKYEESLPDIKKWHLKQVEENPDHAWTHGNYASFLLYSMGDYDESIKYGHKALDLMNYPLARIILGMAYLVKASQLYKQKAPDDQVKENMRKAKSYGLDKWIIREKCDEFCDDIKDMLNAYRKHKEQEPI